MSGDARCSRPSRATRAQPIAAVAADTPEAAAAGLAALAPDLEVLAPLDARGGARASSASPRSRARPCRGDADAGARGGRRARRARPRDAGPRADARSSRTPPSRAGTATRSPPGSRRRGCSTPAQELCRRFGLRTGAGARDLASSSAAASARSRAPASRRSLAAELARATGRPVRLALDAPRGAARRRPARLDAPDGDARRARATARSTGIELAAVVAMGAGGWIFPVAEPARSLYALRRRPRDDLPRPRRACAPRTPSAPPA